MGEEGPIHKTCDVKTEHKSASIIGFKPSKRNVVGKNSDGGCSSPKRSCLSITHIQELVG